MVMGATGVIGGRVMKALLSAGCDVKGASRSMTGPEWVKLDILAPGTHARALEGVTTVMLAARPGDEESHVSSAPFIETMRRSGVRRVVLLSALGAQLRPEFSLRKVELLLESSGLAWTFVRPNFFMQMLAIPPLSAEMAARGVLRLPAGRARIAYVHADDVAAVLARALLDPGLAGRGLDVSGPRALDHYEVASAISAATGRDVKFEDLSDDEARRIFAERGLAKPQVEQLILFYSLVRKGYCATPDGGASALLGRPLIEFSDFAGASRDVWMK